MPSASIGLVSVVASVALAACSTAAPSATPAPCFNLFTLDAPSRVVLDVAAQ